MKQQKVLVRFIKIPKIFDNCYLMFAQTPTHVPFAIKRVYFILNSKTELPRGCHAHHKNCQVIFCIQGTIKIMVDNGEEREEVILDQPEIGLILDRMVWHEMHDFQKDTILMVLASRLYESEDYIRDYQHFLKLAKK